MPATVTVALAWLPARDDDDVAKLRPTTVETIVDHEPSADAGAEREHDQIGRSPPRPEAPLGERRRIYAAIRVISSWV